jgi:hypothetical protein
MAKSTRRTANPKSMLALQAYREANKGNKIVRVSTTARTGLALNVRSASNRLKAHRGLKANKIGVTKRGSVAYTAALQGVAEYLLAQVLAMHRENKRPYLRERDVTAALLDARILNNYQELAPRTYHRLFADKYQQTIPTDPKKSEEFRAQLKESEDARKSARKEVRAAKAEQMRQRKEHLAQEREEKKQRSENKAKQAEKERELVKRQNKEQKEDEDMEKEQEEKKSSRRPKRPAVKTVSSDSSSDSDEPQTPEPVKKSSRSSKKGRA